ncbi:hypothetical protein [Vreelandella profundi]|uniref:hypothetical protein n=1 Tax=Vreelandella profundi TaxID=2852117 RepID=UPI001F289D0E|nr:hypothetical protein [Halomonas profundi]
MKQDHQIQNFDVDDILEALEADRNSGSLPDIVTRSAIRYGVDPDNPERLVAVDAQGKQVLMPLRKKN